MRLEDCSTATVSDDGIITIKMGRLSENNSNKIIPHYVAHGSVDYKKTTHTFKLNSEYFDKIKSGEKIYEIRLNDDKRKMVKVNDTIIFQREPKFDDTIEKQVEDLLYFSTFEKLADALPINEIGFTSKEELIRVLRGFYKNADDEEDVLAIKLKH